MSNLINHKYHIEAEVLTPLHVGAGSEKDWMKGADFIQDNGKIYVLNHRKLLTKMSTDELSSFLVKKDDRGLKNKISGSLEDVSDLVFDSPASTDNDIKVFIKNGLTNKPIVPGSSIKGAIRSILIEYFLDGNKPNRLNEKEIFGDSNKGDEFMRFIKISDADFEKTELVNTKIFNLYGTVPNLKGGWKHSGGKFGKTDNNFKPTGFNTTYEVIKPKNVGELSIALSYKAFDNFNLKNFYDKELTKASQIKEIEKKEKEIKKIKKLAKTLEHKESLIHSDIQNLFSIINNHIRKYIDKQIDFFEKYSNNETENIIKNLKEVKDQIPKDNSSCVLKMSAGSGFHSITGDWQFDDFSVERIENNRGRSLAKKNGKKTAKSRKIAVDGNNFYLMGFVKLTVLDEETIAKREAEKQAKLEAKRKVDEERIAKEKAEQERIEAEKRAEEEAERKAEEERLAKEQAEKEKRERILKEKEEEEKRRQEANKDKLDKGLSALEQEPDYNSGKNLITKYKKHNKIGKDEVSLIKSFVEKYFTATDKEWKNFKYGKRWNEIRGWVGKDVAKQWFDELMK